MLRRSFTFIFIFLLHAVHAYDGIHFVNSVDIRFGIVTAGVNASLLKSQHYKSSTAPNQQLDWPGMGYSAGAVCEMLGFTNITTIGLEASYLNTRASFHSYDFGGGIPESVHYLRNSISEHQLELPVYLKVFAGKEKKEWYALGGVGLKYLFSCKRLVEHVSFDMNDPGNKAIGKVYEDHFEPVNGKKGKFFLFGAGKSFPIKKAKLSMELRYMQDMKVLYYRIAYMMNEQTIPIDLKTVSIRLSYYFYS